MKTGGERGFHRVFLLSRGLGRAPEGLKRPIFCPSGRFWAAGRLESQRVAKPEKKISPE